MRTDLRPRAVVEPEITKRLTAEWRDGQFEGEGVSDQG